MTLPVRYLDLEGRRALVVGGSSGIGLGIAEAFLDQGMKVAIHYRSHEAEARALAQSAFGNWTAPATPVPAATAPAGEPAGKVREQSQRVQQQVKDALEAASTPREMPEDN